MLSDDDFEISPLTLKGRFQDPALTVVYQGPVPDAGYAITQDGRLWRNGRHVGEVAHTAHDHSTGADWIHYRTWPGSPLDPENYQ